MWQWSSICPCDHLVRDSIFYLKFECKGIPQGSPRITEIFISPLHTGRLAGRRWAWSTWRLSDHEKSATALPKRSKNLTETNPLTEFIWNFIAFQDSWWDPGPSLYLWGVDPSGFPVESEEPSNNWWRILVSSPVAPQLPCCMLHHQSLPPVIPPVTKHPKALVEWSGYLFSFGGPTLLFKWLLLSGIGYFMYQ